MTSSKLDEAGGTGDISDDSKNGADQNLERGSQAVHRVLRILLCWKEQDSTLSLTEIAQRTNLTLPTAHRMIKALQRESFLVHDKISGNYALGPTILDLARVLLQRSDQDELVVTVIPHLERIREIRPVRPETASRGSSESSASSGGTGSLG